MTFYMDADFKLLKSIKVSHLFEKDDRIVIGVSGGADSVVLLDALTRLQPEYRFKLCVAHVNYGLRGRESDRDERFVKGLAKKYNIPCVIASSAKRDEAISRKKLSSGDRHALSGLAMTGNLQNSARDIRYNFFLKVAKKVRANKIAVAHHANDQAETILIHLTRGAGLSGLAGMSEIRDFTRGRSCPIYGAKRSPLKLVRPLLNCTKEDILLYAKERRLKFVQDRTNRTRKYHRNVIRHDLLPLLRKYNPNIVQHLCKTAAILRDEDDALNEIASRACHPRGSLSSPRKRCARRAVLAGGSHVCNCVPELPDYYLGDDSKVTFKRIHFLKHHPAIQRRILRLVYAKLTGGTADLLTDHIDKMIWVISSGKKEGHYSLPRGVKFIRKGDRLLFSKPV